MAAEARLARPLGAALAGAGLPAGAEAAAERLVAEGATALLSFGLAGGLDPRLRAGALVIPEAVLENGRRYATDPALSARFGPASGLLLAGPAVLASAADKQRSFAATGALAIDLESGAVGRVAARRRLPFAVLRAVCDPAERSLPPAALAALDARGAIALWRVLAALARQPGEFPALLGLARDAAAARGALRMTVKEKASF